jgi:hypothetical protein
MTPPGMPGQPPIAPTGMPVQPPVAPAGAPVPPTAPAPKKKFPLKLVLLIGGGVLLILAILIACSIIFKPTTPGEAAINLLEKGNFTIEGSTDDGEITMQVNIDYQNKDVTVYVEEDGDFSYAIYDGYMIMASYDYWYGNYYYASDYSEQIDAFFEALENKDDLTEDNLTELLEGMMGIDPEDYFDMEELIDCVHDYGDNLSSTNWLEENAGYSTETKNGVKLHIYEPNLYKFLYASIETFESAFLYEDDYEELIDELKDVKSEMREYEIRLTLGVDDDYLVSCEIEFETRYESNTIEFEFTDIGKTRIDMDELESILDEAEIY